MARVLGQTRRHLDALPLFSFVRPPAADHEITATGFGHTAPQAADGSWLVALTGEDRSEDIGEDRLSLNI